MQSFKYSLPTPPPERRPQRNRFPGRIPMTWVLVAAALAAGGGLFSLSPAPAAVVDSLGRLVGKADTRQQSARADALLAEGETHMQKGDYSRAADCFEHALTLEPALVTAYRRARDAHYLEGKGQGLELEALLPDPARRAELFLALGDAERAAERLPAALAAYEQAIALAPEDPRAFVGKGQALMAHQRYAEAISTFEQASRLRPHDPEVAGALITARFKLGDDRAGTRDALALYGQLAAQDGSETVQVGLMEAYVRQGLAPDDVLAKVPAPNSVSAAQRHVYLGLAYLRHYLSNPNWNEGSYDRTLAIARGLQADKDAEVRRQARQLSARAYAARARRFYERSDFTAAGQALDQALALKDAFSDKRELADLYARRGRLLATAKGDGYLKNLETALTLDPQNSCRSELAHAYSTLGVALLGVGKPQEALKPLKRALTLTPDDSKLYARYDQALTRSHVGGAFAACGQAAGLSGTGERALELGRGLLALGDRKDATALLGLPGLPAAHRALLQLALATSAGERDKARAALARSVKQAQDADIWLSLAQLDQTRAQTLKGASVRASLQRSRDEFRQVLALRDDDHIRGALLGCERGLVEASLASQQFTQADHAATRALLLAPHNPWLSLDLGIAATREADYERAAGVLRGGLEGLDRPAHPAHARLCENLGRVLRAQKHLPEAIEVFKQGLAEEVDAPPGQVASLYYELAFTLAENQQREEALNAIHQYRFWSLHDPQQSVRVASVQKLEASLKSKQS